MLTLWDRKGTQLATWGLIWSLWVLTGLKWTHFEWPYFAVAKLGLNWSQSVSFWVATTKLHPQRARTVSFWVTPSCKGWKVLSWSQSVPFWVATVKLHPHGLKWTHSPWSSVDFLRVIKSFILMFVDMYLFVPEHLVLRAPFTDMD